MTNYGAFNTDIISLHSGGTRTKIWVFPEMPSPESSSWFEDVSLHIMPSHCLPVFYTIFLKRQTESFCTLISQTQELVVHFVIPDSRDAGIKADLLSARQDGQKPWKSGEPGAGSQSCGQL